MSTTTKEQISIKLAREQREWLEQQVQAGQYPSLDDAIEASVSALQANDADAWVKPLLDEARAEIAQGRGIPSERVHSTINAHLAKLKHRA